MISEEHIYNVLLCLRFLTELEFGNADFLRKGVKGRT